MTGVATDRGVLTTARDAQNHGIFTVVVQDAVGSFTDEAQARGLDELRLVADLCSTSTVIDAWGQ
jgi:nicotinamidase-related amidase